MKKFLWSGFTLGEALIALAIVGIIVALTVPNVIDNYQKKSFAIAAKKNYLNIQESLIRLQTENYRNKSIFGTTLQKQEDQELTDNVGKFLTENFRINNDCGETAQPCFAPTYRAIDSSSETAFSCDGYSVSLSNGASVCMIPASISHITLSGNATTPGRVVIVKNPVTVYLDTNGPDTPNIGGRDMFTFNIYEDFSIDEVSPTEIKNATVNRNTLFDNNCKTSSVGKGCFNKLIIDKWKMNY